MEKEVPQATKYDQRLARWLVKPLVPTPITPNHVTTAGLLCGLAAAAGFASGEPFLAHWAAIAYVLAELIDHADGELARLAGKTSRFGHLYDRAASATTKILLFVSIGCGQRGSMLGGWALLMGLVAGLSIAAIFRLQTDAVNRPAGKTAKAAHGQPGFSGFDLEDMLYLVAPITWLGWHVPFLVAACIGAPAFACWMVVRRVRAGRCS